MAQSLTSTVILNHSLLSCSSDTKFNFECDLERSLLCCSSGTISTSTVILNHSLLCCSSGTNSTSTVVTKLGQSVWTSPLRGGGRTGYICLRSPRQLIPKVPSSIYRYLLETSPRTKFPASERTRVFYCKHYLF